MGFRGLFGGGSCRGEEEKAAKHKLEAKAGMLARARNDRLRLGTNPWEMMPGLFGVLAESVEDCQVELREPRVEWSWLRPA